MKPSALRAEMAIVMLISLGQSAVYAVLSIVEKMTRPTPLNQQVTQINTSATPDRPWLDLAYQVAWVTFPLMPVVLVLFLLAVHQRPEEGPWRVQGFDLRRPKGRPGLGPWHLRRHRCRRVGLLPLRREHRHQHSGIAGKPGRQLVGPCDPDPPGRHEWRAGGGRDDRLPLHPLGPDRREDVGDRRSAP